MKYFTNEWRSGDCEDFSAFDRYDKYLESVAHLLPSNLMRFRSECTLHDSRVEKIACFLAQQLVHLELRGWDVPLEHPIYYRLRFSGVKEFEQVFPQGEFVESELGDLGYWEIEAVTQGTEVRMLFVSEAQFRIVFEGFSFEHEPISA